MQASLFGMRPAPPAACRVLELGAGDGGNLLPMALALPGSTFVGIDLAAEPVARGRAMAAELGAGNLELLQGDIAAPPAGLGEFDYIVSHGVYSWIPPKARDALLAASARLLADQGVAYVSYNAYPGSYLRDMTRDILQFHLEGVTDPEQQLAQARQLLGVIVDAGVDSPYAQVLRDECARAMERSDAGLFHDDLADVNTPVYFHEFAAHAGLHGLQFLAEVRLRDSQVPGLPDDVAATLAGLPDDVIVREQYVDFLVNRTFRQTLLCHAGIALDRRLRPASLDGAWLAAPLRRVTDDADGTPVYEGPGGSVARPQDARFAAALEAIAAAWPCAVAHDALVAGLEELDRRRLGTMLLRAHAAGLLDLHRHPPAVVARAGSRPRAGRLAVHQARAGQTTVTNLRHGPVRLEDPLAVHLLSLLDGTRDRERLLVDIRAHIASGALNRADVSAPADLPAALEAALHRLAQLSLLEA